MKVCLVLSASVQCLLTLSQNEKEAGNCEDMVLDAGESKRLEAAEADAIGV